MNKYLKIVLFGFLLWLIPFIAGFPFVDASGNFLIHETFFKSIMIVVGGLVGVTLAVIYFREIGKDHVREGVTIGVVWLMINLGLDLVSWNSFFIFFLLHNSISSPHSSHFFSHLAASS